ncbi:MAG: hypothetical protein AAF562_14030 [Pseudomonadota bacterium]
MIKQSTLRRVGIAALYMAIGAFVANVFGPGIKPSAAHVTGITRLEMERAVANALKQSQPNQSLNEADVEGALRRILGQCQFYGQLIDDDPERPDDADFRGKFQC